MSDDRVHAPTWVENLAPGDVVLFDTGVQYPVASVEGGTVAFEGGFTIDYPPDGIVTVLRVGG